MCELGGGCDDSCESGCNGMSMLCKKRDWSQREMQDVNKSTRK